MAHAAAPAADEFTAEARSCEADKVKAPEIGYRTVISMHHPILDASVLLMENFAEIAIRLLARRNQLATCKKKRLRSAFFSQLQTLAVKLPGECLSS